MDSAPLLIYNAHLYTPTGDWSPGWLLVEGQIIRALGAGLPPAFDASMPVHSIDAAGHALLPGFIDLHVHGAMGYEVMDASPEGLRHLAQFYARHGVTSFLATTWTASPQAIMAALNSLTQVPSRIPGGAAILGAHLEGPFLNPARCGAQDTRLIRRASRAEALPYLDTGLVRLLAVAPEFPENLWLIDECVRRGITVAAGHTDATYEQMQTAVQHGLSQMTHCFNAMSSFGHRQPGAVGAALSIPQLRCELIADNIHVHPAAQKILVDAKQPQGVILITDAIRGAGLPDGDYPIDNRTVTIHQGAVRLPDGTLAGSVLTMERALHNACQATGRPLAEIWIMSSLNAARSAGVSHCKGSLENGKDADLVLLDQEFNVLLTVVEGQIAFQGAEI